MSVHTITKWLFLRQSPALPVLSQFLYRQCTASFSSLGRSTLLSKKVTTQCVKTPLQAAQPALNISCRNLGPDQQKRDMMNSMSIVTIWEDLKQIPFSPAPALVLGFSGLLPFVSPPVYMILSQTYSAPLALAQTVYGACILAFLGGVRWGYVIPEGSKLKADWFNMGCSVTPALVACMALLLPQPLSILAVMGGIAGTAYLDTVFKGYPSWFKGMRFTLSLGAVLSLWTVFLCKFLLNGPLETRQAMARLEEEYE